MSTINWNPVLDHLERERDEINDLIIRIRRIAGMAGPELAVHKPQPMAAPSTPQKSGRNVRARKTTDPSRKPVRVKRLKHGTLKVSGYDPASTAEIHPQPVQKPLQPPQRVCSKNSAHTRFYGGGKGACADCAKEYQKKYALKKKSNTASPPAASRPEAGHRPPLQQPQPDPVVTRPAAVEAAPPPQQEAPAEEAAAEEPRPQYVYSKQIRCSKCQNTTRYRRLKDADLTRDSWTCMMRGCTVKISYIQLGVDREFSGAAA